MKHRGKPYVRSTGVEMTTQGTRPEPLSESCDTDTGKDALQHAVEEDSITI